MCGIPFGAPSSVLQLRNLPEYSTNDILFGVHFDRLMWWCRQSRVKAALSSSPVKSGTCAVTSFLHEPHEVWCLPSLNFMTICRIANSSLSGSGPRIIGVAERPL